LNSKYFIELKYNIKDELWNDISRRLRTV